MPPIAPQEVRTLSWQASVAVVAIVIEMRAIRSDVQYGMVARCCTAARSKNESTTCTVVSYIQQYGRGPAAVRTCQNLPHPSGKNERGRLRGLGASDSVNTSEVGYAGGRAKREIRIERLELLDEPSSRTIMAVRTGSSGRDTGRWSEVFFTSVSARGVSGQRGFSGLPRAATGSETRVASSIGLRLSRYKSVAAASQMPFEGKGAHHRMLPAVGHVLVKRCKCSGS
ncbi:hypothetical protein EDB84DRAFT_1437837 [Lactarius hengduanensis]|nr:hypothetical protein EDB84DRAFT_1437837 [Lactarius hengduanensis]